VILVQSPKLSDSVTVLPVVLECRSCFEMSNSCNKLVFSSVLNLTLKHYKHYIHKLENHWRSFIL